MKLKLLTSQEAKKKKKKKKEIENENGKFTSSLTHVAKLILY